MKWKLVLPVLLFTLSTKTTVAMTSDIVVENGDLVNRIQTNITNMPAQWRNLAEGTTYSDPTGSEVTNFLNNVFSALYNKSFETAATNALALDYQLVAFTDNTDNNTYYILERDPASVANNYWGTYVFNPSPDRGQLIIQSPHPSFDTNTGKEGIYVFKQIGAGFFFMSGTHRCSSPTPSGCAGTSSVCSNSIGGVDAPQEFVDEGSVFREGDVAHNEASMFQKVTEWVQDDNASYYFFIQLHGFSQNLTPHVILSNGRDENTTPPIDDKLTVLRTQLITQWDNCANSNVSLDIEVAHDDDDHNFNSLLGTTNTQGRYINGSITPCTQSASQNTGNFVHIEMGKKNGDFFLRDEVNFSILGKALINTFLEAPLPVELISFTAENEPEGVVLRWKTSWEADNSHFQVQRSLTGTSGFEGIGFVAGHGTTNDIVHYRWTDNQLLETDRQHIFYRLKQVDFNGNFEYSEVISVEAESHRKSRHKLLLGNKGNGTALRVNLPGYIRRNDLIQLRIVHTSSGQSYLHMVSPESVQDTIKKQLLSSPPGLYQIRLSSGTVSVTDKFLRL